MRTFASYPNSLRMRNPHPADLVQPRGERMRPAYVIREVPKKTPPEPRMVNCGSLTDIFDRPPCFDAPQLTSLVLSGTTHPTHKPRESLIMRYTRMKANEKVMASSSRVSPTLLNIRMRARSRVPSPEERNGDQRREYGRRNRCDQNGNRRVEPERFGENDEEEVLRRPVPPA